MPLPAKTAGRVPRAGAFPPTLGTGATRMCLTFERRPARSLTLTETWPAFVPGGTRTTYPTRVCSSLAASAPLGQRNETRMPLNSRLPLICSWRPMSTLTPPRHLAVDAGTQRMRASSGLRCLAWAAAGASRPATASATRALEALRAPVTLKANRVRRWKFRGIRRLTLTSQMGHEFRQRPPRVGLSMLAKAAVAALVIVLCSGGAVAASILLQVHKIVHPAPIPGEPKPEPALKIPTE